MYDIRTYLDTSRRYRNEHGQQYEVVAVRHGPCGARAVQLRTVTPEDMATKGAAASGPSTWLPIYVFGRLFRALLVVATVAAAVGCASSSRCIKQLNVEHSAVVANLVRVKAPAYAFGNVYKTHAEAVDRCGR